MTRDPRFLMPEHQPLELSPEHQARVDASRQTAEASHAAGMARVLSDAEAGARRLVAAAGLPNDPDVYGAHCENCKARWCLPTDQATCAHKAICEDCFPNGCAACEQEVEAALRHREETAGRILSSALELRTAADDLSEADLRALGHIPRKDVAKHVALTIEALRRVEDVLRATGKRRA